MIIEDVAMRAAKACMDRIAIDGAVHMSALAREIAAELRGCLAAGGPVAAGGKEADAPAAKAARDAHSPDGLRDLVDGSIPHWNSGPPTIGDPNGRKGVFVINAHGEIVAFTGVSEEPTT